MLIPTKFLLTLYNPRLELDFNFFATQQKKNACKDLQAFLCTQTRDRTGMDFTPLVFETSASTNSAIWA